MSFITFISFISTYDAIQSNAPLEEIRKIASRLSPEAINLDYNCALLEGAIRKNRLDVVTCLLSLGADPNLRSSKTGDTPLHAALKVRNLPMIQELLGKEARLEARDEWGWSCLDVATSGLRSAEIVELFLRYHASPSLKDSEGQTPLHKAVMFYRPDLEVIRLLLQANADPNAQDNRGNTALHIAAIDGKVEAIRVLLQAPGIDPNTRNAKGETPLAIAASKGHVEAIRMLLHPEPRPAKRERESAETEPAKRRYASSE